MSSKRPGFEIEAELTKSLVLGLRWEYAKALQKAPKTLRRRVLTRPNIILSDIGKLGIADPEAWTIQLKRTFATSHRFDAVRDVFLHEVAHLWASVHLLIDITPNIQCWSESQNPLRSYLESLDRVYDLDVELTLPGHRRLINDHRSRIAELKEHHSKRCNEILGIVTDGNMSAYEIASRMTWDIKCDSWEAFPLAQKWFATGEAISHLRYLKEKGRIERMKAKKIYWYCPIE